MSGYLDSHAHFEGTDAEIAAILDRALAANVGHVVAVGGSSSLNDGAVRAAAGRPHVLKALGWDREQVGKELPELNYDDVAAVGEIGLDYHYSPETRTAQLELFSRQLELAARLNKPVIIHTRDADDDTLGVLREIPSQGVIHCFTGNPRFCRSLLDLGLYISISGIVTFRAADNVRESAVVIPDDRLLIETDSPFLAPVPMRGNPNEPAFLPYTAKFLAELRKTDPEMLMVLTAVNGALLFAEHNRSFYP